ncbi:MAG: PilZ domain-containing protein [Bacillota bacterium]|nr:PilZ domain-containing protein [Bacillota bacterium]
MEERRKNIRYNMDGYPVLISDNENDWEKANLVNISGTGAKIKCNSYYPCDSLYLELPRPFVKILGSYFIRCDIMWSKYSDNEDGYCEYGVRFEKLEIEDERSLSMSELIKNC